MEPNQFIPNSSQPDSEPPKEPVTETKTKLATKTLVLGLAGLAVLAAGVITLTSLKSDSTQPNEPAPQTQNIPVQQLSQQTQTPKPVPPPEEDSTAAISQQLNNIIVTDLDGQFKDIDADLNQL